MDGDGVVGLGGEVGFGGGVGVGVEVFEDAAGGVFGEEGGCFLGLPEGGRVRAGAGGEAERDVVDAGGGGGIGGRGDDVGGAGVGANGVGFVGGGGAEDFSGFEGVEEGGEEG